MYMSPYTAGICRNRIPKNAINKSPNPLVKKDKYGTYSNMEQKEKMIELEI